MIELINVNKYYKDKHVLKDINLDVKRGEILALLGLSGAGKTTLLKVMNLLEDIDSGKIIFDGIDVTNLNENEKVKYRRRMCLVFQKPEFFRGSVFDNIAYGLKVRKVSKREIELRVKEALEIVGLKGYEKRNVKTLSAGEAQRVNLARALVIEPEVLLLDEPTSNLDPKNTEIIENIIKTAREEKGVTIVIATHDQGQALRISDRIAIINDGKLEQVGYKEDILFNPRTLFVAKFLGMKNIFKGYAKNGKIFFEDLEITVNSNINGEVFFGIRPEDIMIVREGRKKENMLRVKIERINLISASIYEIESYYKSTKIYIHVPRHVVDVMKLYKGKYINISLKKDSIRIFPK